MTAKISKRNKNLALSTFCRDTFQQLPRTQKSLSLFFSRDENLRAKEGGKEKTSETCIASLLYGFPWFLALSHQSLAFCARLNTKPCENEAPEEEAGIAWFARNDPLY